VCSGRLPFDTVTGEAVYAEASVKGKKKDAVLQCALNACRMLDAQDILRHSAPGTYVCACMRMCVCVGESYYSFTLNTDVLAWRRY